ncbi:MAG TPA: phosphate signaling complex protein PhoU [bacterium]|nr:phosphate signaling complex protein PhoU [bacterium]
MERHFHEQLQELKNRLLEMGARVEKSIDLAIESLVRRDSPEAEKVIQADDIINQFEIEIDDRCLKLLALQQPMAGDLRFITSAMKINNDLERMGDHAVNIAERAVTLNSRPSLKPITELPKMAAIAVSMVRESLNCFVNGDAEKARELCKKDDEVDGYDDRIFHELLTYMTRDKGNVARALDLLMISKNLERIADLSTNIAEEVIFIYKAKTIKHHLNSSDLDDVRSRS